MIDKQKLGHDLSPFDVIRPKSYQASIYVKEHIMENGPGSLEPELVGN
jgi:hypothetical protein